MTKLAPNELAFALEANQTGREQLAVMQVATARQLRFRTFKTAESVPPHWIPVGSVTFCEGVLGSRLVPNYLPGFLSAFVKRRTWTSDTLPAGDVFVKPLDAYKRLTGCPAIEAIGQPGPFLCSERVEIVDEWRYYVADGRLLTTGWYAGRDENAPAPDISADFWPPGYCGAVDFARLADGRLELIEAQHPCACGWYGENPLDYVEWLACGWRSLQASSPIL